MSRKIVLPNVGDICRAYEAGESQKQLAIRHGVSRPVISRLLIKHGIRIRGMTEAVQLSTKLMPPEKLKARVQAAHAAVRGKPQTFEHRSKIAAMNEAKQNGVSRTEEIFAGLLRDAGFAVTHQKAVGTYNIDLALHEHSIAVEVFGGHWHTSGRHAARHRKRMDYLLDRGWTVVIVWVNASNPIEVGAVQYIVALLEALNSGKSPRCHEYVITGRGEPSTIGKDHLKYRSAVP